VLKDLEEQDVFIETTLAKVVVTDQEVTEAFTLMVNVYLILLI
jgi:hypothetical protein